MTETWCVLIQFTSYKVLYLVHLPTEAQKRGYKIGRLYVTNQYENTLHQLKMFTDAPTVEDALENAKRCLRDLVEVSA